MTFRCDAGLQLTLAEKARVETIIQMSELQLTEIGKSTGATPPRSLVKKVSIAWMEKLGYRPDEIEYWIREYFQED